MTEKDPHEGKKSSYELQNHRRRGANGREGDRPASENDLLGGSAPQNGKLVGFARVISDYATTYYLCDVIIDTEYQHRGLGTALVSYIESLPEYAGLRGILITRDAHALYRRFGYEVLNDRTMVKGLNC